MSDEKKSLVANETKQENVLKEEKIDTPYMTALKNFLRNKLAVISLAVFVSIFILVFVGSSLTTFYSYYEQPVLRNIKPGFGYLAFPKELEQKNVIRIDSGITFSVALTDEHQIYVWGIDYDGVLDIPQEVKELSDAGRIVDVAAGDRHIIVLDDSGQLHGWGNNFFHQTELVNADGGKPKQFTCPPGGCPEELLAKDPTSRILNEGIARLSAGDQFSVILTKKNSIYAWGSTLNNKLDQVPKRLNNNVIDFSIAPSAILVITKDHTVDGYGTAGNVIVNYIPEELKDGSVKVVDIAITSDNGFALDDQGNVYGWGPKQHMVSKLPEFSQPVVALDSGRDHVVAKYQDGTLITWGSNYYGETDIVPVENAKYFSADFFQNYAIEEDGTIKTWGNNGFLLGSDERGRDLFVRILHGGRVSLRVGAIAVVIQIILGTLIGMISGFRGGLIDNLIMRFAEIVSAFPFYPLVITLSATLPPDVSPQARLVIIMLILGFLGWPGIARLVRGQILAEREKDFVLSAKALGIKDWNIIIRHILPNILNIVIVQITLGYASSLLSEAGLSFLGFGVPFPFPSWGNMLSDAQAPSVIESYWWRWVFPGLIVFLTALSVNMIGDGLRDALDPKSNEK